MKSKKLLIVDDEPIILKALTYVLRNEDYSIRTASNGVECLDIARKEDPDLILLDVIMPTMDGFETIKNLRLIKKFNYTPIIFLTGQGTTPDSIDSGYSLGGNEYWIKTMSPQELVTRIRAILRIADLEKNYRALQQSFYSTVVNDLHTPLGTILDASEYLLEDTGALDKYRVALVSEINTAAVRLLRTVKDLLQLSNLESGDFVLDRKQVQLHGLVTGILNTLNVTRNRKSVEVKVDIEESLAVSVDEKYFQEVLENLFDNALRFTPVNGTIFCTAKRRPAKDSNGADSIVIEFSDTGWGIVAEEIPTLFDKGRITNIEVEETGTRAGLGLVICREIIEAHDGTIAVESKIGEGTKFIITLPAC
jgi:two-component system, sensor histidine kinase and response regulator